MAEHIHDMGYKRILAKKKNFLSLLRNFVRADWVNEITEDSLTLIDKEFISKDFKEKEADIIYRVNFNGQEVIFYCLLELQSSVDYTMPFRLLIYMTEIWRRIFADTEERTRERSDFQLPAIVPLVLYNGNDQWSAVRNFKAYLNGHEQFQDNLVSFEYIFLNVNQYSDEELRKIESLISSVFLMDKKQSAEQLKKNIVSVLTMLQHLTGDEQVDFWDWYKDVLTKKLNAKQIALVNESVTNFQKGDPEPMTYAIERLFDEIEEQGIEQGLEQAARNMLEAGMEASVVSNILRLPRTKVDQLCNEADLQ